MWPNSSGSRHIAPRLNPYFPQRPTRVPMRKMVSGMTSPDDDAISP